MKVKQTSENTYNISVNVVGVDIILHLEDGSKTELLSLPPKALTYLDNKISVEELNREGRIEKGD